MSTASTPESTNRTVNTPKGDNIPCVQYGFPKEEGPIRAPKLRTIFEPVPDGATTASPVYGLPKEQYERQRDRDDPYRVGGGYKMKATELQDECEDDGRVLYPIHIESDVYHEEGPETLLNWFHEFVENTLDVPFHTCTLYFSGRRSIHVHVPRFVSGEADRERLKEQAEAFCDRTGADLDLGLYSRKRMFRLPGVKHGETGLLKVEIEPTWGRARIFRESNESNPGLPPTYAEVLRRVFLSNPSLVDSTTQASMDDPQDLFNALDPEKTVLKFTTEGKEVGTPLIEQEESPDDRSDVPEWSMYNTKEFSPYAFASGNPRSVAALKVKRGPFARKEKRGGATMVPAYFYGAIGCNGEFTKAGVHAPLQLSKRDYRKWGYKPGDNVVVIGGKSGSSRLLDVDSWEATVVGHAITGEDRSRQTALDYLSEQGYDVGASGSVCSTSSRGGNPAVEGRRIWPARQNPKTEAEELQRQAEQNGIDTLTHKERIQVACRHLRYGWDATWEWFRKQFGSDFKPDTTHRFLRGIVEEGSFDEYDSIEVPDNLC